MTMASLLVGDVISLTPYTGLISYESDATKSLKNKGVFYGLYTSVGNLSYLFEADFSTTNVTYKPEVKREDPTVDDISQYDVTLTYGRYWQNSSIKGGVHYLNSNDPTLGDGIVGIISLGAYKFVGYDKYSLGIEGFLSYYNNGHDDSAESIAKSILIFQISPYYTVYNVFGDIGNLFTIRGDYQITPNFVKKSYFAYEISDTLYYKSFFVNLHWHGGEIKTGVFKGGFAVNNTLDLQKSSYGGEIGYNFSRSAVFSAGYDHNRYLEYGAQQEGYWDRAMASFTYKF